MSRLFAYPGYARFWSADTVSTFGTYVTTVAMPTLAVVVLKASDTHVGLLNGARWTPYLVFGLLAGVVADRYRRRPILAATDLARGIVLAVVAGLAAAHMVTVYELAGAQFFAWVALGASGPNEMAYRQSATPDRPQGRGSGPVNPQTTRAKPLSRPTPTARPQQ